MNHPSKQLISHWIGMYALILPNYFLESSLALELDWSSIFYEIGFLFDSIASSVNNIIVFATKLNLYNYCSSTLWTIQFAKLDSSSNKQLPNASQ